jgi:hypothetical protein
MFRAPHPPQNLSVEEIEAVAVQFKENLTGECERFVRRGDNSSALAAILGKEYIDRFVYDLKLLAGATWRQQQQSHSLPPRARPIRLPKKSA